MSRSFKKKRSGSPENEEGGWAVRDSNPMVSFGKTKAILNSGLNSVMPK